MYLCLNRGTTGASLGLREFAQLASNTGFQGCDVDLNYAVQHGATALADLFAQLNLKFGGWAPVLDHRTPAAERNEKTKTFIAHAKIASQLKIDSCATWIMPSSEQPFQSTWRQTVEGLAPVASILRDQGLRLGLEFVAPYHLRRKHAHEFIFTPGLMLELADEIGPNVGLLVDSFHAHCAHVPWEQFAALGPEKIVLVHVNDAPPGPVEQLEDGKRLLPGDGVLDLPSFFRALQIAEYRGPVSLEAFGAVSQLPEAQAAHLAWEACRRLLPYLQ